MWCVGDIGHSGGRVHEISSALHALPMGIDG